MPIVINPITTTLFTREEFDKQEHLPMFSYILEPCGLLSYYTKLTVGRFICAEEADIPGLAKNASSKNPDYKLQPLAHGNKIPMRMFHQIHKFFVDVLGLGKGQFEAQTFIIWNEKKKDYRIFVPKQVVSAASVTYDINGELGPDDHIIMDIHSHNNMGAFFSGTDDHDDQNNPWVSGVMGKISGNLEYKFRFNDGCGRGYDMDVNDLFFDESDSIKTPDSWLKKVELRSVRPKSSGLTWADMQNGEFGLFDDVHSQLADEEPAHEETDYNAITLRVSDALLDGLHYIDVDEGKKVLNNLITFYSDIGSEDELTDIGTEVYDKIIGDLASLDQFADTVEQVIAQFADNY